jgi:SAM-dependent methyltransferase
MKEKKEWIYSFFGRFYKEAWEGAGFLDKRDPEAEAAQILELLSAPPGSHILDWCGGWGRHAIPLAKMGFRVTILDFCAEYLQEAGQKAKELGVQIETVEADFRNTPPEIQADYAVNLFTAGLGYLGRENDLIALNSLSKALKPGALFLIDTANLFWIAKNFQSKSWSESVDGKRRLLERRSFDFFSGVIVSSVIYQDTELGIEEANSFSLRTYSPVEFKEILESVGFKPLKLYGGLDGSDFSFESKRLVMVSQRP